MRSTLPRRDVALGHLRPLGQARGFASWRFPPPTGGRHRLGAAPRRQFPPARLPPLQDSAGRGPPRRNLGAGLPPRALPKRHTACCCHRAASLAPVPPNLLCPGGTRHAAANCAAASAPARPHLFRPSGHTMPLLAALHLDAARLHRLRPAGHGRPLPPRRRAAVIPSRRCGSSPRHLRFPRSGTIRPPAPSAGSPSPPRSSPLRRLWR